MNGYAHAVLARDGVSLLWIVDECHVDSDQRCSVCCQYLTSDYRHQASERERERQRQPERERERIIIVTNVGPSVQKECR